MSNRNSGNSNTFTGWDESALQLEWASSQCCTTSVSRGHYIIILCFVNFVNDEANENTKFPDLFVPLDMNGWICHFAKWQIHPFISKGTNKSGNFVFLLASSSFTKLTKYKIILELTITILICCVSAKPDPPKLINTPITIARYMKKFWWRKAKLSCKIIRLYIYIIRNIIRNFYIISKVHESHFLIQIYCKWDTCMICIWVQKPHSSVQLISNFLLLWYDWVIKNQLILLPIFINMLLCHMFWYSEFIWSSNENFCLMEHSNTYEMFIEKCLVLCTVLARIGLTVSKKNSGWITGCITGCVTGPATTPLL